MKYFITQELVSPKYYKFFREEAIRFIQPPIIAAVDLFRELAGVPVLINTWHRKGFYCESGLRDFDTKTGSGFSMHKFGGAADPKIIDWTSQKMYELVMDNQQDFLHIGITRLEHPEYTAGKFQGWLHMDCTNVSTTNGIITFKP